MFTCIDSAGCDTSSIPSIQMWRLLLVVGESRVTKSGEICTEHIIKLENMVECARAPFVSVPSYRGCGRVLPRVESSCIKGAQGLVNDGVSNHQSHDCLLNCLFKAQIKENIKAPRYWPLWGEFTGDRWIPHTKGKQRGKCFHLMMSCWK